MIPKIEFKYSWIYDQNWREWIKLYPRFKGKYPDYKKIQKYIKKVEPLWRKQEKKIMVELSKIIKLSWKDKEITCYVVGRCIPFSDPLTLGLYKNTNWFIDTLTHELIHQLFSQKGEMERSKKAWDYFFKKYKKESRKTIIHIPLHAIHANIYLKLFNEKRLKENIKWNRKFKDYRSSWEIVEKEGYENIIKEFRKRLR